MIVAAVLLGVMLGVFICSNNSSINNNQTQTVTIGDIDPPILDKTNLNTATYSELINLPGIGDKKANAIIASRNEKPFENIFDLVERGLVGSQVMSNIKDGVVIK